MQARRQRDRQTDRQTDRQADRQTDRQTDTHTYNYNTEKESVWMSKLRKSPLGCLNVLPGGDLNPCPQVPRLGNCKADRGEYHEDPCRKCCRVSRAGRLLPWKILRVTKLSREHGQDKNSGSYWDKLGNFAWQTSQRGEHQDKNSEKKIMKGTKNSNP